MLTKEQKNLLERIFAADRTRALELIDQWAKTRNYSAALSELLEPVIREFGIQWSQSDEVSLAQGYIAGKIAEDIVQKAIAESSSTAPDKQPRTAILGNIEDDYHQLGRRLVASFLSMHSWQVIDLGNDVLAETFVDQALHHEARVIGVSSMMYSHALKIAKVREEIDKRNLTGKIRLAVGGAVFNENLLLAEKVGGDGTAANAIDALDLFETLWQRALFKES